MARTFPTPSPSIDKQSHALGNRLKLARLRRKISMVAFAERTGVSRETLRRLEAGDPNVALGTYLRALTVLDLDKDIDVVARDDEVGRKLQDQALIAKPRASAARPRPISPPHRAAEVRHPQQDSEGDDFGD